MNFFSRCLTALATAEPPAAAHPLSTPQPQPRLPQAAAPHVLLVHDQPGVSEPMAHLLAQDGGLELTVVASGLEAIKVAARRQVQLLVSDLKRPGEDVEAFLALFAASHPAVPIVVITGSPCLQRTAGHPPEARVLQERMRQLGVARLYPVDQLDFKTLQHELQAIASAQPWAAAPG
jgi:CheY-like chemotaxis protein